MATVGLVGYPVQHSLSPRMQRAAFEALGMEWEYRLLAVAPGDEATALRAIRAEGWRGFNVTVPHKETVLPLLDEITPEVRAIGAVNTVVHDGGKLIGYNTDWRGFLAALREAEFDPAGARVLLLGAGGAARAVVYALLSVGASITLANRSAERAHALARAFPTGALSVVPMSDVSALQNYLHHATLLVNSTSVGMSPNDEGDPLPPALSIPAGVTVYDLVYAPRETRLLRRARNAGARSIGGLGMLVHQGAEAFRLWTGVEAPVGVMRGAVE